MKFTNENGDSMNLADDMTIKELLDMGVSISVSEENDPEHQIWLAEPQDELQVMPRDK